MSHCCNPNEPIASRECDGAIDPMAGNTIPEGYAAVQIFVNSQTEWETDPLAPDLNLPTLLLSQAGGGILIAEGIYLAIA
jgi:hypothetical protein